MITPPSLRSFPITLAAVSLAVLASGPLPANGATNAPALASPLVHPEVSALFMYRARTGRTLPTFRRSAELEETGRLPVVVRWLTQPDASKRTALAAAGVFFERDEPAVSGAWLATITEGGLQALTSDPELRRVSVDLFHSGPRPLDGSLVETAADVAKRAAIAKDGVRLDGAGTVIADIDSPVYLHHPAFFRADGRVLPWVDIDGDRALTPGVDGIDLDGSGVIEAREVLHDLRATSVYPYSDAVSDTHAGFQPDTDYLFIDTNGNGKRDHGAEVGEATPAYGEPLFVFDDANHDGKTELSERVIELKTSKFRKIISDRATYTRGGSGNKALSAYPADTDEQLAPYMGHATGVAGILAGGQAGHSRWAGIAPDADLVLFDGFSRGPASAIDSAVREHANVILTEFAPYTNVSLDGSSEEESMLDAAADKGVISVSPAGNLAKSFKHRTLMLEPGSQTIPLASAFQVSLVSLSLHYQGPKRKLSLSIKLPKGDAIPLSEQTSDIVELPDAISLYTSAQTTPRGTHERFVNLFSDLRLPRGEWELIATLDDGAPLEVELFVGDDMSSWSGGFTMKENTPSRTICNPATSDKTIAVAAYVLHGDDKYLPAGAEGNLASYSSRGPTLGGDSGIDIAAPDNPLSPSPPVDGVEGVAWSPFGGTSGAGPHVAAAIALLEQAYPEESAADLRRRILDGARPFHGEPIEAVGRGRLDVAHAIGATALAGASPTPAITVVASALEARLRVDAEDDEPTDGLTARWDLDYDGTFDTGWLPLGAAGEQTLSFADAPRVAVKVEVRDAQGNLNGATSIVAPGTASDATVSDASDAGCGCRTIPHRDRGSVGTLAGVALLATVLRRKATRRRTAVGRIIVDSQAPPAHSLCADELPTPAVVNPNATWPAAPT